MAAFAPLQSALAATADEVVVAKETQWVEMDTQFYSIEFPAEPKQTSSNEGWGVTNREQRLKQNGIVYVSSYFNIPSGAFAPLVGITKAGLADRVLEGVVKESKARIYQQDQKYRNLFLRTYCYETNSGDYYTGAVIIAGGYCYQFSVKYPMGLTNKKELERFADSFQLKGRSSLPSPLIKKFY
jgi:hypothetical protein